MIYTGLSEYHGHYCIFVSLPSLSVLLKYGMQLQGADDITTDKKEIGSDDLLRVKVSHSVSNRSTVR